MFINKVRTNRIHEPLVLLILPGIQHVVAIVINGSKKTKHRNGDHADECSLHWSSEQVG